MDKKNASSFAGLSETDVARLNRFEGLSHWRARVDAELNLYAEYLQMMEAFLQDEVHKHTQNIQRVDESNGGGFYYDEMGNLMYEAEFDEYRIGVIRNFQNTFRKSFFINLYSFLEKKLFEQCEIRSTPSSLKVSEIRGNGLERVKIYFTKVLHVDFPSNTKGWQEIQNYRRLRNNIVHNRGRLDYDNTTDSGETKTLRKYVEQSSWLDLIDDYICIVDIFYETPSMQIYLGDNFCGVVLRTIRDFLFILGTTE